MKKEVIQDYDIEDFEDISITIHNSNSFTIECTMEDRGAGLIDIDFYNNGDLVDILEEIYIESKQINEFIIAIYESVGIGDWCEEMYGRLMCGSEEA